MKNKNFIFLGPLKTYICSQKFAKNEQNKQGVQGNTYINVRSKK